MFWVKQSNPITRADFNGTSSELANKDELASNGNKHELTTNANKDELASNGYKELATNSDVAPPFTPPNQNKRASDSTMMSSGFGSYGTNSNDHSNELPRRKQWD